MSGSSASVRAMALSRPGSPVNIADRPDATMRLAFLAWLSTGTRRDTLINMTPSIPLGARCTKLANTELSTWLALQDRVYFAGQHEQLEKLPCASLP